MEHRSGFYADSCVTKEWVGRKVTIQSANGRLIGGQVDGNVVTTWRWDRSNKEKSAISCLFCIEQPKSMGETPFVTLRLDGSDLYLTATVYGDAARGRISAAVGDDLPLPSELKSIVFDYVVDSGTHRTNAEGHGFHYGPITIAKVEAPNVSNAFELQTIGACESNDRVGFRSFYGSFLRSPSWSAHLMQSPHLLDDETFLLRDYEGRHFWHS